MTKAGMRNIMLRILDERLSNTGLETHYTATDIDDYMEQAFEWAIGLILRKNPKKFCRRTNGSTYSHLPVVGGEDMVDLPGDFIGPLYSIELISGGDVQFRPLSFRDYSDCLKEDNTLEGEPLCFDILGSQIFLWPKPSGSSYSLRVAYAYSPSFPVSDSVEVEFPKAYQMLIVYKALCFAIPNWGISDTILAKISADCDSHEMGFIEYLNKPSQVYESEIIFKGNE